MAGLNDDEEMCIKHNMEIAYFCQSHDLLGCQACMHDDHQDCENVKAIDELAKDVENSQEYKHIRDDINEIKYISEEINGNIGERENFVEKGLSEEKDTLDRLRAEINNIFDCIQSNIEEKESNAIAKDTGKIKHINSEADHTILKLESIENKLENLKRANKRRKCFITMKKVKSEVRAIENKMEELVTQSKPHGLGYHAHLPEVKGETEIQLIKMEEALVQFKLLISKNGLANQD